MSTTTTEFYLDDVRVITRGGLLNPALVEEIAKNRWIDPFDLIGREDEIIRDFVTTAILRPYYSVKHF